MTRNWHFSLQNKLEWKLNLRLKLSFITKNLKIFSFYLFSPEELFVFKLSPLTFIPYTTWISPKLQMQKKEKKNLSYRSRSRRKKGKLIRQSNSKGQINKDVVWGGSRRRQEPHFSKSRHFHLEKVFNFP